MTRYGAALVLGLSLPIGLAVACVEDEGGTVGGDGGATTSSTSSTGTGGGGGVAPDASSDAPFDAPADGTSDGGQGGAPPCLDYTSQEEEYSPVQTTGGGLPRVAQATPP